MSLVTDTVFSGVVHPLADKYPMMPDDRLAELALDIAANGLRESIWIDVDGNLLDGRNRLAACREAGVVPTFAYCYEDDIEAFIVSKNEHRRDLTPAQRVELRRQRVAALHAQEKSTRQIAEEVGVSHTQVRSDLVQVESDFPREVVEGSAAPSVADPVEPPRVTGRDGKSYPAKKDKTAETDERWARIGVLAATMTGREVAAEYGCNIGALRRGAKQRGITFTDTHVDTLADTLAPAPKKLGIAERWAWIAELAPGSLSSAQIAAEVGMAETSLRAGAKTRGIAFAADAVMSRARRTDSNQIVDRIVNSVDIPDSVTSLIDYTALDVTQVDRWIGSLTESVRSLTTLKKKLSQLKEPTHG